MTVRDTGREQIRVSRSELTFLRYCESVVQIHKDNQYVSNAKSSKGPNFQKPIMFVSIGRQVMVMHLRDIFAVLSFTVGLLRDL